MEDRNAMERTVAVRVAALVVVVGLLVGIGQGALVDRATAPVHVVDDIPMVASAAAPAPAPHNFDFDMVEMTRPVDTF